MKHGATRTEMKNGSQIAMETEKVTRIKLKKAYSNAAKTIAKFDCDFLTVLPKIQSFFFCLFLLDALSPPMHYIFIIYVKLASC